MFNLFTVLSLVVSHSAGHKSLYSDLYNLPFSELCVAHCVKDFNSAKKLFLRLPLRAKEKILIYGLKLRRQNTCCNVIQCILYIIICIIHR